MRRRGMVVGVLGALLLFLSTFGMTLAQGNSHVVQAGDTLSGIASRYGVSVQALASANGIGASSWVYAGQRLTIPGGGGGSAPVASRNYHVIRYGETLSTIAQRYGTTAQALMAANNLNSTVIYVGQRLAISGSGGGSAPASRGTHIVSAGETLSGIASRYGTSVSALMSANGLRSTTIYVGQRLALSGSGGGVAQPPAGGTGGERWISVNLTNQTLTAYEGQTPVYNAIVSTGIWKYPTVVGTYRVYVKYRAADMSGGTGADAYYLANVPYVMYFYQGYGFHGTYWHNNFGTPMSHGCVNLTTADAAWLYNWASVGTKVVTHY